MWSGWSKGRSQILALTTVCTDSPDLLDQAPRFHNPDLPVLTCRVHLARAGDLFAKTNASERKGWLFEIACEMGGSEIVTRIVTVV
ncbi:hypothetical protein BU25DRAFT_412814 [Macroventuria anomochaeta]|uniref:Uncharacterized protein n=1 Tax=Macroventuria anomochaeta TaxID=301207 RepID=A0ACB6RUB0_9PLEO|nr:uncharacterized protein BU25DRAFT_412814 [Macroventuria anomochaeta]KAF2625383.1 hypothetical protein BU25DRAFT_412814 [Macroventuria anomochaeta]